MPKSTATLMALLTLVVGYLIGSTVGLSELQGNVNQRHDGSTTEQEQHKEEGAAFASCEEKFKVLKAEVNAACGPKEEAATPTEECLEVLATHLEKFQSLAEFCTENTKSEGDATNTRSDGDTQENTRSEGGDSENSKSQGE